MLQILAYLPERIRQAILAQPPQIQAEVEEVRLREGRPVALVLSGRDLFVSLDGGDEAGQAVTRTDLDRAVAMVSRNSLYAFEDELRQGFLTLPGGHRVGLAGKVVLEGGRPRTISPITGLNYRVSRAIPGVAEPLLPALIERRMGSVTGVAGASVTRLRHTLVISPPGAGKTTLLRDIARLASEGCSELGLPGQKVTIVDERSELAGCYMGRAQLDVGARTDVLDGCPKADGIMLALRALSPQVVVTDEIGRPEDASAIEEAVNGGVTVLATAHGADLGEVARRPTMGRLVGAGGGVFERIVTLTRNGRPGVVGSITDGAGRPVAGGLSRCS